MVHPVFAQHTTPQAPRIRVRYGAGCQPGGLPTAPLASVAAGYATGPAAGLRARDPAALHTLAGATMGTTWSVRLANPGFEALEPVQAAVQQALDTVVQQMSHWEAGSEISRFNRAEAGTWQVISPEFMEVLACALHWSRASQGAWDPTVGPLVDAWGFGPRANPLADHCAQLPHPQRLQVARTRVGFERLQLSPAERRVLQPGGAQLDLSGIAKGFGVDLVARTLQRLGFGHFLVEVGGELRASGQRPDGQPWRVQIAGVADGARQPPRAAPRVLPLRDRAVATSGDHWHAFDLGGRRYSHTLDPRTGEPVLHRLSSVTVLHAECMQADALATVLTVLGPHEGLAFAQRQGIAALLCEHTDAGLVVHTSAAFEQLDLPARVV